MSLKEYASRKIRRDTAGNWSSNNPTPLEGEWCLETDTGNVKIGDGSTAWNDLGYYIPAKLAIPYDLTSANKTHTLPPITGAPQTESVYWTGGGTHKLTIKTNDGTPLDYNGEGNGHILVESDGSNWQVREYEDSGSVADSGGDTDRKWWKYIDGSMKIIGSNETTNTSASAVLEANVTFGKSFSASGAIMNAPNFIGLTGSEVTKVTYQRAYNIGTTGCIIKLGGSSNFINPTILTTTYQLTGRWK